MSDGNEISVGAQTKFITINPGDLNKINPESPIDPFSVKSEKAQESGVYLQHNIEVGDVDTMLNLKDQC